MADTGGTNRTTGPMSSTGSREAVGRVTQLGRYRLLQKLGVGGSATVFLAIDTTIDKKVALKVLHEHLREDPVTVRRFANDARALAKLNHPNIVQIYAAELDQYYFAMEHVEGPDLSKLIAESGAIPPARAVAIGIQMADALAHIHRQGLVHRDVKPGNVLISAGDRIKMTDFSIARESDETMLTLKGSLIGTVEYMAPEQIREEDTDVRVDIYAVGAVLYEMLAGRPPFARDAGSADLWPLMERILKENPIPLREINPSIPEPLTEIVSQSLEKSPAARPATMDEFIERLRACVETAATIRITPVALARPVELPDGSARLAWTAASEPDFDKYEIHGSGEKDFVASDQSLIESVRERDRTEISVRPPAEGGIRYYRVRSILRGGVGAISNRTSIEFGEKPPLWRRRGVQIFSGAVFLILLTLGGFAFIRSRTGSTPEARARPPTVGIADRATVTGAFGGAQFFPTTGRYRFTLATPVFKFLDTGTIAANFSERNIPRITVEIPRAVGDVFVSEGVDLTLLPRQPVTVTGKLSENAQLGLILSPDSRGDVHLEKTAPAVRDVTAADWKNFKGQIVRLTATVTSVEIYDNSNSAILMLEGGVKVYVSSAIKSGFEMQKISLPDLEKKFVTVIGVVRYDKRFDWEIIVANPNHLKRS